MPRGTQNHALAATCEVDVVVLVENGQVAGVEPAVFQNGIGGFLVFIIAQHHAVAFDMEFPDDVLGVGRVDAGFGAVDDLSAGAQPGFLPRGIGDEGGTFGHAVTDCKGESDFVQEQFDFVVESSSTDDDFLHIPAECLFEFGANLLLQLGVEKRNFHHELHERFL